MNYLREIKWAWQRVVRGYDDRVFWGFDGYFETVLPALKEFCYGWALHDYAYLNEEKMKVFAETIILIEDFEEKRDTWTQGDLALSKCLEYVGKHIGYYWD